jgi:hypothetical protein
MMFDQGRDGGARSLSAGQGAAGSELAPFLGEIHVTVKRSVFADGVEHHCFPALGSIADKVDQLGLGDDGGLAVITWLNGKKLERGVWHRVRPKSGAIVGIALLPGDGRTALLIGGALASTLTAGFAAPAIGGGWAASPPAGSRSPAV